MSNKDNPIIGAEFQEQVRIWFEMHYGKPFVSERKIAIGVYPQRCQSVVNLTLLSLQVQGRK
jgi:hypothetical protein